MVSLKRLMKGNRFEYIYAGVLLFFFMTMNSMPYSTFVTIDKTAPWVLFYANELDRWQGNSGVLVQDFKNQGWQIQTKIKCETRSNVRPQWNLFKGEYGNNPAICVLSKGQTPTYSDGAYYWGGFIIRNVETKGMIFTASYDKHQADFWIIGNAKKYDADDYTFVKFIIDNVRPVIIIWTGQRFDTGDIGHYVKAWRWVTKLGDVHTKNWYIFDSKGLIIDSQHIINDEESSNEPNPETNPLLNHPEYDDDLGESMPYIPPEEFVPEEESLLRANLIWIEIGVIGFLIVGLVILLIKHKKRLWGKL